MMLAMTDLKRLIIHQRTVIVISWAVPQRETDILISEVNLIFTIVPVQLFRLMLVTNSSCSRKY